MNTSRRQFLSAATLGFAVPHVLTRSASAQTGPESKNDRPGIGAIGMRYQGAVITEKARAHGDIVAIINHMGNFFDCVASRRQPISDVESQHRSVSTCHLGNISMRVGRPIKWDARAETILEDSEANSMLRREQRRGFEVA